MVREILPVLNVLLHRRTDTVASVAVAVMGDGALPNLFSTRKSKLTTVIMKTTTTMDLPTHPDHHRRRRHRNPPALRRSEGTFSRVLWLGLNRTVRSCHCPPFPHCREGGLGRVWSTYPKFNPAKRVEWTTWPLSCG